MQRHQIPHAEAGLGPEPGDPEPEADDAETELQAEPSPPTPTDAVPIEGALTRPRSPELQASSPQAMLPQQSRPGSRQGNRQVLLPTQQSLAILRPLIPLEQSKVARSAWRPDRTVGREAPFRTISILNPSGRGEQSPTGTSAPAWASKPMGAGPRPGSPTPRRSPPTVVLGSVALFSNGHERGHDAAPWRPAAPPPWVKVSVSSVEDAEAARWRAFAAGAPADVLSQGLSSMSFGGSQVTGPFPGRPASPQVLRIRRQASGVAAGSAGFSARFIVGVGGDRAGVGGEGDGENGEGDGENGEGDGDGEGLFDSTDAARAALMEADGNAGWQQRPLSAGAPRSQAGLHMFTQPHPDAAVAVAVASGEGTFGPSAAHHRQVSVLASAAGVDGLLARRSAEAESRVVEARELRAQFLNIQGTKARGSGALLHRKLAEAAAAADAADLGQPAAPAQRFLDPERRRRVAVAAAPPHPISFAVASATTGSSDRWDDRWDGALLTAGSSLRVDPSRSASRDRTSRDILPVSTPGCPKQGHLECAALGTGSWAQLPQAPAWGVLDPPEPPAPNATTLSESLTVTAPRRGGAPSHGRSTGASQPSSQRSSLHSLQPGRPLGSRFFGNVAAARAAGPPGTP